MSITTISMLINRQIKENMRLYGISILVLFGVLSFMFLLVHQWQDSFSGAVQNGVFIIGLFVGGGIFTNSMFNELSTAPSSIWFLSLPAKHSEKVISSIIVSTLFFLVVYLIIFYLVDAMYLLNTKGLKMEFILNPLKDDFYIFFFLYFLFNGAILLGSVVFTKHSLIKTILACILFFIALNYLNNAILEFLLPDLEVVSSMAFDSFQFRHLGENVNVYLPKSIDLLSAIFIRFILPISIWVLVWFKLKEKQV